MRRFFFPPSADNWKEVAEVREQCRACETENLTLLVAERPQLVIDQFLASICLFFFDIPEEEVEGHILIGLFCADRFTGWMLAQPIRKEGPTGEKGAKVLRKNWWGQIWIPAIITTDQDPL